MGFIEKRDGFPGQRIVVLPRSVVERALAQPITASLLPTDVGFFPSAKGHLRERPEGIDQAIFIYCVKGAGWCDLAGTRHRVGPGDLLVIPPETPHVYGADEKLPWTAHWFHARGSLTAHFLDELHVDAQHPVVTIGEDVQVLALFNEVLGVVEHGYSTPQLIHASHALGHLLAILVRAHRNLRRSQPTLQQRIAQSIAFMKEHLSEPLTLDGLGSVANLSRSQFTALFKAQTGYPPIDYLIRLRLHHACQLLDTTDLSVKEIALAVGYEDSLYFSRLFHRVNEVSPKEYRLRRKG
jgi:AraC-like DNA-binding protein